RTWLVLIEIVLVHLAVSHTAKEAVRVAIHAGRFSVQVVQGATFGLGGGVCTRNADQTEGREDGENGEKRVHYFFAGFEPLCVVGSGQSEGWSYILDNARKQRRF